MHMVTFTFRIQKPMLEAAVKEAKRDGFDNVGAFIRSLLTHHFKVHP